jgi:TPR repeat protein
MARTAFTEFDQAAVGVPSGELFYRLGMNCSTGRGAPLDLVAAHKWLNIAAARGHQDAVRLRREVASDMSEVEIAAAQRAARNWLKGH